MGRGVLEDKCGRILFTLNPVHVPKEACLIKLRSPNTFYNPSFSKRLIVLIRTKLAPYPVVLMEQCIALAVKRSDGLRPQEPRVTTDHHGTAEG
mmetsp:Transcript_22490/g.48985  ORF Transcript_22490/g.48985 Transcript_22490/m.48985 type:complete len:94 (+) Transcript_22490:1464-1745(+)